ncbi:hypothetical protein A3860_03610 [Niastella vici]|uniref:RDD domain-containing protein n=1 Tax=Niastella vici TaxID=1703345 RepID=A0A1V9FXH5_9BACT|nr:RDD family protein [Niastella vici]OQP63071.1 hypothetical protein A3860_03610 [Niastella vici]
MEQNNQADLLQDIQDENYVDPVSKWIRLANYIVDQIVTGVIVNAIEYGLGILNKGGTYNDLILSQDGMSTLLYSFLISFGVMFTYYTVFETATNGRTIGKILTGTIAINQDGSPFTFKQALLRTLCRFIPLEPIGALFAYMPWHDSITKTAVVKKTW